MKLICMKHYDHEDGIICQIEYVEMQ